MITTQVTWAGGALSDDILQSLSISHYPAPTKVEHDPVTNDQLVTRTWPDQATAQEWIDLVTQHGATSAVIVPE